MSLKDKILIAIIIIGVIIIGVCLHSTASINIGGITINEELDLAEYLAGEHGDENKEKIIRADVQGEWFYEDQLKVHGVNCDCGSKEATIAHPTAYCVQENQSDFGGTSKICNVIDFRWNPESKQYDTTVYIGNGTGTFGYHLEGEEETLAKLAYTIGKSEHDGNRESGAYGGVLARMFHEFALTKFANDNGINKTFAWASEWTNDGSSKIPGYTDALSDVSSISTSAMKALEKIPSEETPNVNRKETYVILGPFQMNLYNGNKVTDINISDGNNSLKAGNQGGIEYCINYGETGETWSSQISDIPSGQKFYIRIQDQYNNYSGTNWKVTFISSTAPVYDARMFLTLSTEQNKLFFAGALPDEGGDSVTYELGGKIIVDDGDPQPLKVIKYGGIEEDGAKQPNVNFYLESGGKWFYKKSGPQEERSDGYPKNLDNGSGFSPEEFELREWNTEEHPYTWTTDANGELNFQNLDSSIQYTLFEAYNGNAGYEDYINIKSASMTNGIANPKPSPEGSEKKNQVEGIQLSTTQENVLKIIDDRSN